jgi:hypothetical protein
MVKGIVGTKQDDSQSSPSRTEPVAFNPKNSIPIGPEFWASDKGLIVKAIVLNRAYKKYAILRATGLTDARYRNAATELFHAGLLTEKYPGNLWVTKDLYVKCLNNQREKRG